MSQVIAFLAEGSEGAHKNLPLDGQISPLFPYAYDMVWSSVCLVAILILFWKYVLPKYNEVLERREQTIADSLSHAEEAQEEAKAALEKYNSQLAEARAEATQIREEARSRGKRIVEDEKARATEEANRIITLGEKQLEAQREKVISELRKEMGLSSVTLAERLLGDQLDDAVKRSGTIDRFLDDLDDVAPAGK